MFKTNLLQIPAFLVSEMLKNISGNALKLLLIILYKTHDFNFNVQSISLTQFKDLCLLSRPTIIQTLAELEQLKLIEVVRKVQGDKEGSTYRLNPALFKELIDQRKESLPVKKFDQSTSKESLPVESAETRVRTRVRSPETRRSPLTLRSPEQEQEQEKTIFNYFLKIQSLDCKNPRIYANSIRVKYKNGDQYTQELYEAFKLDFLLAQQIIRDYKGKEAVINGEKLIFNTITFSEKECYLHLLDPLAKFAFNKDRSFAFFSPKDIKDALTRWVIQPSQQENRNRIRPPYPSLLSKEAIHPNNHKGDQ
jgi:DNA-binding PadR family transcriptional regulator